MEKEGKIMEKKEFFEKVNKIMENPEYNNREMACMGIDCDGCPINKKCSIGHHSYCSHRDFLKSEYKKYTALEYRPLILFPEDLIAF